jgi:hypothetical protein
MTCNQGLDFPMEMRLLPPALNNNLMSLMGGPNFYHWKGVGPGVMWGWGALMQAETEVILYHKIWACQYTMWHQSFFQLADFLNGQWQHRQQIRG